jgi:hypothetical protein
MAIWHAGNTISNILSGFLAAGILTNMGGILGLTSWQWFFLIEGAASILVALAGYWLLPDWPHNTRFLTEQEREMAQYRVLLSNGGVEEKAGGTWDGLKDAVRDPFTWIFCLMHFALVTAQSFKDFMPSVSFTSPTPKRHGEWRKQITNLTYTLDHGDLPLRQAYDLLGSSTSICHRLRVRLRHGLVVGSLPGVILARGGPHCLQCRWMCSSDQHTQRGSSLFRLDPPHIGHLLRPQLAALVGDDASPCTQSQEGCSHRHC